MPYVQLKLLTQWKPSQNLKYYLHVEVASKFSHMKVFLRVSQNLVRYPRFLCFQHVCFWYFHGCFVLLTAFPPLISENCFPGDYRKKKNLNKYFISVFCLIPLVSGDGHCFVNLRLPIQCVCIRPGLQCCLFFLSFTLSPKLGHWRRWRCPHLLCALSPRHCPVILFYFIFYISPSCLPPQSSGGPSQPLLHKSLILCFLAVYLFLSIDCTYIFFCLDLYFFIDFWSRVSLLGYFN